jgi:hypothetical protein
MGSQAANDVLPTNEPSAFTATGNLKKQRFRNWKMMAIELAIAVFGFYVFAVTTVGSPTTPGIVCIISGIGALWLFRRELSGISIDSKTLSMPNRRIRGMPFLSFRQRTVRLSEVRRLTRLRWFGFDVVKISGDFGWDLLIFASCGQRRRFIALIQSIFPEVATYRIRPQSDQSAPLRPYKWLGDPTALRLIPDRPGPEITKKAAA